MDIRVVGENIFYIESDCVIYFVDNAFSDTDTNILVEHSGDRLLDVFSKLSSLPTGEFKVVPAFNLKTDYILLSVIPKNLDNEKDEKFLKEIFENITSCFERYEFNTIAIDIKRLENSYGKRHSEIFKNYLRNLNRDLVVFLCK